jgi:hypothetical protein
VDSSCALDTVNLSSLPQSSGQLHFKGFYTSFTGSMKQNSHQAIIRDHIQCTKADTVSGEQQTYNPLTAMGLACFMGNRWPRNWKNVVATSGSRP